MEGHRLPIQPHPETIHDIYADFIPTQAETPQTPLPKREMNPNSNRFSLLSPAASLNPKTPTSVRYVPSEYKSSSSSDDSLLLDDTNQNMNSHFAPPQNSNNPPLLSTTALPRRNLSPVYQHRSSPTLPPAKTIIQSSTPAIRTDHLPSHNNPSHNQQSTFTTEYQPPSALEFHPHQFKHPNEQKQRESSPILSRDAESRVDPAQFAAFASPHGIDFEYLPNAVIMTDDTQPSATRGIPAAAQSVGGKSAPDLHFGFSTPPRPQRSPGGGPKTSNHSRLEQPDLDQNTNAPSPKSALLAAQFSPITSFQRFPDAERSPPRMDYIKQGQQPQPPFTSSASLHSAHTSPQKRLKSNPTRHPSTPSAIKPPLSSEKAANLSLAAGHRFPSMFENETDTQNGMETSNNISTIDYYQQYPGSSDSDDDEILDQVPLEAADLAIPDVVDPDFVQIEGAPAILRPPEYYFRTSALVVPPSSTHISSRHQFPNDPNHLSMDMTGNDRLSPIAHESFAPDNDYHPQDEVVAPFEVQNFPIDLPDLSIASRSAIQSVHSHHGNQHQFRGRPRDTFSVHSGASVGRASIAASAVAAAAAVAVPALSTRHNELQDALPDDFLLLVPPPEPQPPLSAAHLQAMMSQGMPATPSRRSQSATPQTPNRRGGMPPPSASRHAAFATPTRQPRDAISIASRRSSAPPPSHRSSYHHLPDQPQSNRAPSRTPSSTPHRSSAIPRSGSLGPSSSLRNPPLPQTPISSRYSAQPSHRATTPSRAASQTPSRTPIYSRDLSATPSYRSTSTHALRQPTSREQLTPARNRRPSPIRDSSVGASSYRSVNSTIGGNQAPRASKPQTRYSFGLSGREPTPSVTGLPSPRGLPRTPARTPSHVATPTAAAAAAAAAAAVRPGPAQGHKSISTPRAKPATFSHQLPSPARPSTKSHALQPTPRSTRPPPSPLPSQRQAQASVSNSGLRNSSQLARGAAPHQLPSPARSKTPRSAIPPIASTPHASRLPSTPSHQLPQSRTAAASRIPARTATTPSRALPSPVAANRKASIMPPQTSTRRPVSPIGSSSRRVPPSRGVSPATPATRPSRASGLVPGTASRRPISPLATPIRQHAPLRGVSPAAPPRRGVSPAAPPQRGISPAPPPRRGVSPAPPRTLPKVTEQNPSVVSRTPLSRSPSQEPPRTAQPVQSRNTTATTQQQIRQAATKLTEDILNEPVVDAGPTVLPQRSPSRSSYRPRSSVRPPIAPPSPLSAGGLRQLPSQSVIVDNDNAGVHHERSNTRRPSMTALSISSATPGTAATAHKPSSARRSLSVQSTNRVSLNPPAPTPSHRESNRAAAGAAAAVQPSGPSAPTPDWAPEWDTQATSSNAVTFAEFLAAQFSSLKNPSSFQRGVSTDQRQALRQSLEAGAYAAAAAATEPAQQDVVNLDESIAAPPKNDVIDLLSMSAPRSVVIRGRRQQSKQQDSVQQ